MGVVHRDVKPENLFLVHAPDGTEPLKIVDFGFSFLPEDRAGEAHIGVVGTPEYMAPEQARGAAPGPAADIYALGVVLYELLAGAVPFTGAYPAIARLHAVASVPPIPPERAPRELASLVIKALAKRPEDRFGSMADLRDALFEAVPGAVPKGRDARFASKPPGA